jgi:hypothetical protein
MTAFGAATNTIDVVSIGKMVGSHWDLGHESCQERGLGRRALFRFFCKPTIPTVMPVGATRTVTVIIEIVIFIAR